MLGTDFPYRPFYPKEGAPSLRSISVRRRSGAAFPVDLGIVGQVGPTLSAPHAPHQGQRATSVIWTRHESTMPRPARASTSSRPADRGGLLHPQHLMRVINEKAADDRDLQRPDVGLPIVWAAALSDDERQAPPHRLVLARLDGQCDAAGHRRPGPPRPGRQVISLLRRRRLHHADGRSFEPHPTQAAGEGVCLQQRLAWIRRARTEIDGLPQLRQLTSSIRTSPRWAEAIGVKGIRIEDPQGTSDGPASAEALASFRPGGGGRGRGRARSSPCRRPSTVEMAKGFFALYAEGDPERTGRRDRRGSRVRTCAGKASPDCSASSANWS